MEKLLLINSEKMVILKAAPTVEQLEFWEELLAPEDNCYICGTGGTAFSVYTHLELRMLFSNMRGRDPGEREYSELVKMARLLADEATVDDTPVETLRQRLGRDLPPVDNRPAPEKGRGPKKTPGHKDSGPPSRPKAGSTTAKVWDIADQMAEQAGGMPDRNDVIKACTDQGINPATASTQYGKWKRAQV